MLPDEARANDPAGDEAPEVRRLRQLAREGVAGDGTRRGAAYGVRWKVKVREGVKHVIPVTLPDEVNNLIVHVRTHHRH